MNDNPRRVGAFRLILSLMVVASHVGGMGGSPAGGTAVAGFFTISGFLMARTISENYRHRGVGRFYANRVIRIVPPFLAVLLLTAFVLWLRDGQGFSLTQGATGRYMPVDAPPQLTGLIAWNENPFPVFSTPHVYLLPQAWSLVIEAIFYALAPLAVIGISTRLVPAIWVIGAASLGLALLAPAGSNWMRSPGDTLWMFLAGALAYSLARHRSQPSPMIDLLAAAVAGAVAWVGLGWAGLSNDTAHLLAPWCVVAWLVLGGWATRRSHGFDRWCGNLAYGVFLGHFLGTILMLWIAESVFEATGRFGVFGIPGQSDRQLWAWAYAFAILIGIAIYYGLERPLESVRRRVRRPRVPVVTGTGVPPRATA